MAILKSQELDFNDKTGEVKLFNEFYLDPLLKENYEERKAIGKAVGSPFKPIASIPYALLENDPDGVIFLNTGMGSQEGRLALKRFLAKTDPVSGIPNSQYKTSTANI